MNSTRLALLLLLAMVSCTDDKAAFKALLDSGYTKIELTGYSLGCAKDDSTCTGFHATGPTGRPVRGVVGCGLLVKGCTVRLK